MVFIGISFGIKEMMYIVIFIVKKKKLLVFDIICIVCLCVYIFVNLF